MFIVWPAFSSHVWLLDSPSYLLHQLEKVSLCLPNPPVSSLETDWGSEELSVPELVAGLAVDWLAVSYDMAERSCFLWLFSWESVEAGSKGASKDTVKKPRASLYFLHAKPLAKLCFWVKHQDCTNG